MKKLPYISAFVCVCAGVILCAVAYLLERVIDSSVLWFFAQGLLYAAAVYDISMIVLKGNENNQ